MAEGHSQGPGGGGRNVGNLRLRVHTWLQDTVLGVPVLMMFRREVGSHAGVFGLPLFKSGFAPDGLILAEEFRCALRIRLDHDEAVSKLGSRPTHRVPSAEAALLSRIYLFSYFFLFPRDHLSQRVAVLVFAPQRLYFLVSLSSLSFLHIFLISLLLSSLFSLFLFSLSFSFLFFLFLSFFLLSSLLSLLLSLSPSFSSLFILFSLFLFFSFFLSFFFSFHSSEFRLSHSQCFVSLFNFLSLAYRRAGSSRMCRLSLRISVAPRPSFASFIRFSRSRFFSSASFGYVSSSSSPSYLQRHSSISEFFISLFFFSFSFLFCNCSFSRSSPLRFYYRVIFSLSITALAL